ncbi:MAG: T9SS type A sorting domain-containing protein [Bacteroidetes bacterium]|nr:T9SS type A sorting domain-containing protein [Bacteroidota bacterium]
MKKLLLVTIGLFGIFTNQNVYAQFSIPKDTVIGYANDDGIELHNNITNTGSVAANVSWKIFYNNLPSAPSKWNTSFGLCDNKTCYSNGILSGSTQTTSAIDAGTAGDFHVAYGELSGVTTYGPYYISVEITQGNQVDTTVFVINKFPTGIKNQNNAGTSANVYPIPATNELNVAFTGLNIKSLCIYNLIGNNVITREITGNSAKIDLSNISSGIYFLRLNDEHGLSLITRKFTKQ